MLESWEFECLNIFFPVLTNANLVKLILYDATFLLGLTLGPEHIGQKKFKELNFLLKNC